MSGGQAAQLFTDLTNKVPELRVVLWFPYVGKRNIRKINSCTDRHYSFTTCILFLSNSVKQIPSS